MHARVYGPASPLPEIATMTLYPTATLEPSPAANVTLAILAQAMGARVLDAGRRVPASCDSRSPDEGLALLDAYVAVLDPRIRQAILDAVITIAGTQPYRHVRGLASRSQS